MVSLDLMEDIIMQVTQNLYAGNILGGTNSSSLQHCILCFREARGLLRLTVADFTEWIANEWPPWAAYCMLMYGHLIGLDNHPGLQPVDVGETWKRLVDNCIMKGSGQ